MVPATLRTAAARLGPAGTGMLLGVVAWALFSLHDTAVKWLVTGGPHRAALPVWEILFGRSLVILTVVLSAGRGGLLRRAIRTREKPRLVLRGAILFGAWMCYYSASRALPLAQLLTLYFAAPIVTTLLATPLLGEHIPRARWVAVAVGFAGVVVACDPGGISASWATARVLLAACLWGFGVILLRQVARSEGTLLQMFYLNIAFLLATGLACLVQFRVPDLLQTACMLGAGAAGAAGQFCLFEGARRAPASVMASIEYTALIWAFLLGFLVFGDVPRSAVFLGAGLIAGGGLWLVFTERRRRHRAAVAEGAVP